MSVPLWEVAPDISTHIEAVHRLSKSRSGLSPTAESGTSQEGFVAEWREVALLTIEGDADQPLRVIRRGRHRRRAHEIDEAQPAGTAAGKRCNAGTRAPRGVLRGPRLGRHGRDTGRRYLRGRSPSGRELWDPTRPTRRNRERAGNRRSRHPETQFDRHRDPRGAPCPLSYPLVRAQPAARRVPHRRTHHPRDRRGQPDRLRASRSTSTTSTPPSPSSMRDTSQAKPPNTRTHGRSSRVPMPRSTGANSPRRHRTG